MHAPLRKNSQSTSPITAAMNSPSLLSSAAGVLKSSCFSLYRCNATEEKLELISSDAPTDAFHAPVSTFLKGKLDKMYLYQDGDIATIVKENVAIAGSLTRPPVICFFQPLPVVTTANTSSHIEVIVCLMTNQSSAEYFELMKRDMHNFIVDVYESCKAKNSTLEALTAVLADWYPKPVAYISRLFQLWTSPDALAAFLHLILTSTRVYVCAPQPLATELTCLIERISLSHLVHSRQNEISLVTIVPSPTETDVPLISIDPPSEPVLSSTSSNAFCKTWAQRLLSTSDPLLLCGIIQHTKDLLVQELNSTKRLLDAAKMDHYELFRLFQKLKTHDNTDVIVPMLQSDSGDKEIGEVLAHFIRSPSMSTGHQIIVFLGLIVLATARVDSAFLELQIAGPTSAPFNQSAPSLFGYSLAFNPTDESTIIVGSTPTFTSPTGVGRAYILREDISGSPWTVVATLSPPVASDSETDFGTNVAIDGNIAAVSSSQSTGSSGTTTGSVYIFRYNAGIGWETLPSTTLVIPPSTKCSFGASIALNGSSLLVGCPNSAGIGFSLGSVFLYELSSATPTIPVQTFTVPNDPYVGLEVALSNRFVVASSAVTLYVWERQGSQQWNFTFDNNLVASKPVLLDDHLLINWSYRAVLYRFLGSHWMAEANFTAAAREPISSVALADAMIVIGASTGDGLAYGSGVVTIFSLENGVWSTKPTRKLVATNGRTSAYFGEDVHVNANGTVAVSSFGSSWGAIYLYEVTNQCAGYLLPSSLLKNAICNGSALYFIQPELVIDSDTIFASPLIVVGDLSIENTDITIISNGPVPPLNTTGCLGLRNVSLDIQLNQPPSDGRIFISASTCVNGSFSAVNIESTGCRRYTATGEDVNQSGLSVLVTTDKSRCPETNVLLIALVAGIVGLLVLVVAALGILACVAPDKLRWLIARRPAAKRRTDAVYTT